jgi:hypothetical protein
MILIEVRYEEVSCFKYLISIVTYNNDMAEIKERTALGNRCFQALNSTIKVRYI